MLKYPDCTISSHDVDVFDSETGENALSLVATFWTA